MAHQFNIYINGQVVEVTAEVYKTYHSMKAYEQYLERKDKINGKILYSELDTAEILGEEMIRSNQISKPVEQAVMDKFQKERLYIAISKLSNNEKAVIRGLYFEEKSQWELSYETGIPQTTISYRVKQALKKLRKIITE